MMIRELAREHWEGYPLRFHYATDSHYRVYVRQTGHGWSIDLLRMPLGARAEKHSTDALFKPHWEFPSAFGAFWRETDGEPAGILEVAREGWSNRLRVTNLLVTEEEHRRRGIGRRLMDRAKEIAAAEKRRAVILETQTCNTGAIDFYLAQGFVYAGMDIACYTNRDMENGEVRLELAYFL